MITAKKLQALKKRLIKQQDRLDKQIVKAEEAKGKAERHLKMTTNLLNGCFTQADHLRGQIDPVRALLSNLEKEIK